MIERREATGDVVGLVVGRRGRAISPIYSVEAAIVASTIVGSIDMKERYSIRSVIAGVSARKIASSFPRSAIRATRT
jgi:hypothetical protein